MASLEEGEGCCGTLRALLGLSHVLLGNRGWTEKCCCVGHFAHQFCFSPEQAVKGALFGAEVQLVSCHFSADV